MRRTYGSIFRNENRRLPHRHVFVMLPVRQFFAVRNRLRQSVSRRCGNPCSWGTANSGTAGIRKAFRLPQVVHLEQKSGRTARVLS
ncbi:hypothetical protein BO223_11685 [Faecalibaculum rodentium]|uniref:Uncharacterized protein n=1 Tax=Faecalibaculum rodentium TaxID=1702221 RepID=A0A1Q9YHA4_9FIRM|nr:hypothetical protein BO223_11685 [Faecalibaculum rodentium]